MLILSFNALTSPALLKAVRIQVRPWMQWDHSSLRPLWVIKQDRHVFQRLKELDALGLAAEYFDFDDSPARSFADYNAAVFFGR